jgi:hypothetical protein
MSKTKEELLSELQKNNIFNEASFRTFIEIFNDSEQAKQFSGSPFSSTSLNAEMDHLRNEGEKNNWLDMENITKFANCIVKTLNNKDIQEKFEVLEGISGNYKSNIQTHIIDKQNFARKFNKAGDDVVNANTIPLTEEEKFKFEPNKMYFLPYRSQNKEGSRNHFTGYWLQTDNQARVKEISCFAPFGGKSSYTKDERQFLELLQTNFTSTDHTPDIVYSNKKVQKDGHSCGYLVLNNFLRVITENAINQKTPFDMIQEDNGEAINQIIREVNPNSNPKLTIEQLIKLYNRTSAENIQFREVFKAIQNELPEETENFGSNLNRADFSLEDRTLAYILTEKINSARNKFSKPNATAQEKFEGYKELIESKRRIPIGAGVDNWLTNEDIEQYLAHVVLKGDNQNYISLPSLHSGEFGDIVKDTSIQNDKNCILPFQLGNNHWGMIFFKKTADNKLEIACYEPFGHQDNNLYKKEMQDAAKTIQETLGCTDNNTKIVYSKIKDQKNTWECGYHCLDTAEQLVKSGKTPCKFMESKNRGEKQSRKNSRDELKEGEGVEKDKEFIPAYPLFLIEEKEEKKFF